jgi:hypothetical protein
MRTDRGLTGVSPAILRLHFGYGAGPETGGWADGGTTCVLSSGGCSRRHSLPIFPRSIPCGAYEAVPCQSGGTSAAGKSVEDPSAASTSKGNARIR